MKKIFIERSTLLLFHTEFPQTASQHLDCAAHKFFIFSLHGIQVILFHYFNSNRDINQESN